MARININVGEKVDEKVKEYADFMGMTKSGLCAYWIAQIVLAYENSQNSSPCPGPCPWGGGLAESLKTI